MMITLPAFPALMALAVLLIWSWVCIADVFEWYLIPVQIGMAIAAYYFAYGLLAAAGV